MCFYAAQMLLALEAIHSRDIVYRDLKPENLLLDRDGYIRLTDFGLSKEGVSSGDSGAETFCGTAEYLAPELLGSPGKSGGGRKSKKVPHGRAVDIWSLGVLMYEMIHGLPPFYDTDTRRMYDKILHAELQFSTFFSDDACDLISRMLERDPRRRMTVTEAKSHRFFVRPPAFLPRSSSLRFVDINFLRFASSLQSLLQLTTLSFARQDLVEWRRMLLKDYKPPMVPPLAHELDLSFFDPTFTAEPPCVSRIQRLPAAFGWRRKKHCLWVHNPRRLIRRLSARGSQL